LGGKGYLASIRLLFLMKNKTRKIGTIEIKARIAAVITDPK
jgi:hypothetical protein